MGSPTSDTINFASSYKVRRTQNALGEGIQHVRIDVGVGAAESVVSGTLPVSGTVTVDTSALATHAKQDTGNNSLSSIDGKLTTTNNTLSSLDGKQTTDWALRYDEGATYTYIGVAVPGTAEGSATWRIKRLTNADNTIVWADGNNNLDNIWTNRAALSYS